MRTTAPLLRAGRGGHLAKDRWDAFKQRMDADPRTPPRAAGHDAP